MTSQTEKAFIKLYEYEEKIKAELFNHHKNTTNTLQHNKNAL